MTKLRYREIVILILILLGWAAFSYEKSPWLAIPVGAAAIPIGIVLAVLKARRDRGMTPEQKAAAYPPAPKTRGGCLALIAIGVAEIAAIIGTVLASLAIGRALFGNPYIDATNDPVTDPALIAGLVLGFVAAMIVDRIGRRITGVSVADEIGSLPPFP